MQKKCFKCGEVKPISEFYFHKAMLDKHLGKCKECCKKDEKLRRILRPDFFAYYEQTRDRARTNIDNTRRWRKENPLKYKAHVALNNAVRDGRLTKPSSCNICGQQKQIHAHHYDYSRPLDVIWLCAKCHRDIHSTTKESANA